MRSALLASFALGLSAALATGARALEPAPEPSAAELAAAAAQQRFGGDTVEVWETDWDGQKLQLGLARRWQAGKPEVLLRVLAPHKYETLTFLIRQRSNDNTGLTYWRSNKMFPPSPRNERALDIGVASWIERLPFVPGLPALADLLPQRASQLSYRLLPDETIEKLRCRVLETRTKERDQGYDRIVTVLTRDSNVALETRWFRGERQVRLDRVGVHDIDTTAGRPVVRRHEITQGNDEPQIVVVGRFSLDPVLPDQLFTTSNLRVGRFPSY